jgi:hypothetical protein
MTRAWPLFDRIVLSSPARHTNPWQAAPPGEPDFLPDYDALRLLLGVPLLLRASSQSGVPAKALDVWIAYELRRAGLEPDRVWPREYAPRVLPAEITTLLDGLPKTIAGDLRARITAGLAGLSSGSTLLGKNYVKQVDVVMSSWQTGPELMISTKRMGSSFGKNAPNRVEESYGDAKNLRLLHPISALGFFYALRSTALTKEADAAAWLIDLLIKLGREDDAYDAVGLIVPEWADAVNVPEADDEEEPSEEDPLVVAGVREPERDEVEQLPAPLAHDVIDGQLAQIPRVELRFDAVPPELDPARFLSIMVKRVLTNSPIAYHKDARSKMLSPIGAP